MKTSKAKWVLFARELVDLFTDGLVEMTIDTLVYAGLEKILRHRAQAASKPL